MLFFIVCALLVAAPEVLAARQNTTLVAGSSDNFTFNGDGWQGPGNWQGLDPENESCTESPGRYSWTKGISVSISFRGVAIYFVGWNNSRQGVYQSYMDGVPDSPVTAYIPAPYSGPWYCNVVQYAKTGLVNMQHNLTMLLLTDDPGDIGVPGMGVSGVIVTEEDDVLPLPITSIIPVALPTTPSLSATSNQSSQLATPANSDGIFAPTPSDNSQSFSSTSVVEISAPAPTSDAPSSSIATILASSTITDPSTITPIAANNDLTSSQSGVAPATPSDGGLISTAVTDPVSGTSPRSTATTLAVSSALGTAPSRSGDTSSTTASSAALGSTRTATNDDLTSPQSQVTTATLSDGSLVPTTALRTPSNSAPGVLSMVTVESSHASNGPVIATKNRTGAVRPVDTQRLSTPSNQSRVVPATTSDQRSSSATTAAIPLTTPASINSPIPDASTPPTPATITTVSPPSSIAQNSIPHASLNHSSVSVPFQLTDQDRVVPVTANDHKRSSTTTQARPTSVGNNNAPVLPTPQDERPSTTGSPISTTSPNPSAHLLDSGKPPSHKATIAGSIIGGVLGLAGAAGLISFASWAHQINHAKKASKPGAFKSKTREFNFVIPPYLPGRPRRHSAKSFQITLTLTPVDIEEGYTYQQVAWQRFNIRQSDEPSKVMARLDYDRAFGAANIRTGGDAINGVAFCDHPISFEHAKPGRPVPFKGHAWSNPLQFITGKYKRIIARNEDHVPLRVVIGSYVCEERQRESIHSSEYAEDRDVEQEGEDARLFGPTSNEGVAFQSFVVMDETIGYAQQISASFDLILRIYKTQDVEVGQILSPAYVRHKAVPLLGEHGIRLSKLPRLATWSVVTEGSDVQLKMEGPSWGQYLYQYL